MESYKQTADVFAFVGEFHKKMELFFQGLEEKSDDKRVQMLLEFLRQHENRYADALIAQMYVNSAFNELCRSLVSVKYQISVNPADYKDLILSLKICHS